MVLLSLGNPAVRLTISKRLFSVQRSFVSLVESHWKGLGLLWVSCLNTVWVSVTGQMNHGRAWEFSLKGDRAKQLSRCGVHMKAQ